MVVLLTFGWKQNNIMYCSVINVTAYLKEFLNIPASQKLAPHQLTLPLPIKNRDVLFELP
jgi:hypothetical protein